MPLMNFIEQKPIHERVLSFGKLATEIELELYRELSVRRLRRVINIGTHTCIRTSSARGGIAPS